MEYLPTARCSKRLQVGKGEIFDVLIIICFELLRELHRSKQVMCFLGRTARMPEESKFHVNLL